eukprot:GHVU01194030.1.p1 GENE.GHVU01194030.1~~GHVU01194030.1.p1  ORF type:complete len:189 (+),score=30.95 GHVU01194030.1:240-806(+)
MGSAGWGGRRGSMQSSVSDSHPYAVLDYATAVAAAAATPGGRRLPQVLLICGSSQSHHQVSAFTLRQSLIRAGILCERAVTASTSETGAAAKAEFDRYSSTVDFFVQIKEEVVKKTSSSTAETSLPPAKLRYVVRNAADQSGKPKSFDAEAAVVEYLAQRTCKQKNAADASYGRYVPHELQHHHGGDG